jgi:hypothetical protein
MLCEQMAYIIVRFEIQIEISYALLVFKIMLDFILKEM